MNKLKKTVLLLVTGSFFFCCAPFLGFAGRVRRGVAVNGVEVGGMGYAEARAAVRGEIARSLPSFTVITPVGGETFCYPQISFTDNVSALLKRAKRGERLTATVTRQWADAEAQIRRLCEESAVKPKDANVVFSAKGFRYLKERAGRSCDYERSLARALADLKAGKTHTSLVWREEPPERTEAKLREQTRLIASFTTYFDASKTDRVHNLRLAAQRITGTEICAHGAFSFNATVGKRTKENGFREAAVIFDGAFVQGVGGGVCQASTTLFNAALLAGLEIDESRAHSLSVAYVKPSLDAMVSEYSDLKVKNPFGTSVYLSVTVEGNAITARVFGLNRGITYRTESVVLSRIAPPPEKVVEGEEDAVLRAEKAGVCSESYRVAYSAEGELISRELIRRDAYAVVQGIRQVKKEAPEPAPSVVE